MDPRVKEHARIAVDHSTGIEAGDDVLVQAPPEAMDFVVALHEVAGQRDATVMHVSNSARAGRAFRRALDPDAYELPDHRLAAMEAADVVFNVRASSNTKETADVDPDVNTHLQEVQQPIQEAMMDTTWVMTQHPSPGYAQEAEMSTAAYADFVYDAINKDWEAQRAFQAKMVDRLADAEEVRIVSGDTTDISMSIAGMTPANDYAEYNLPGGEAYTAPVPDSVEGEVLFDKPVVTQGRELEDVYLRFEEGEVVDHAAAKNEAVLTSVLETDEGARRLGELGIGMNRDIDRFTYNMLFDEKMGDTIHLALGRAIDWTVPDDQPFNDSSVHLDMIVDMSENSVIELDGEVVQRDGTFVFEDDFEA
jgi:aminopeptidase